MISTKSQRICRVCLATDKATLCIYGRTSVGLSMFQMLDFVSSIVIPDLLPQQVCLPCSMELLHAYAFKAKLVTSVGLLRQQICLAVAGNGGGSGTAAGTIRVKSVKSINTKHDWQDENALAMQSSPQHQPKVNTAKERKNPYHGEIKFDEVLEALDALDNQLNPKEIAKSFNCPKCKLTFAKENDLKKHIKTHVSGSSDALYVCRGCLRTFETKKSMKEHYKSHYL